MAQMQFGRIRDVNAAASVMLAAHFKIPSAMPTLRSNQLR